MKSQKKLLFVMTAFAGLLAIAGCNKPKPSDTDKPVSSTSTSGNLNSETNKPSDTSTSVDVSIDGKTEKRNQTDTREEVYEVRDGNEEVKKTFKSLYVAIDYCANEGDVETESLPAWSVNKKGETTKLFENNSMYTKETKDMFWFYEDGTALSNYSAWSATYWPDARGTDNITIMKSGEGNGLAHYANGWDLAAVGTGEHASNTTAVWNSCWLLESSTTVDMIPYSGITKSTYSLNLKAAKITPSMDANVNTYAYVGFITADAYNVSAMGLACDTTTGNWYYYSGEISYNSNNIEIEKDKVFMTSTWDETNKCYVPDNDVDLTCQIKTLTDGEGESYIAHRLTADFKDGRVYERDYELAALTNCGTIRFTTGLDIQNDQYTIPDYMNGSSFENIVVTSAKGTVFDEAEAPYDNVAVLKVGEYDLLNSNPESAARFHTFRYNTACSSYDFSTAGKDVYNYSYKLDPTHSVPTAVKSFKGLLGQLPALESITANNKELVENIRKEFNKANTFMRAKYITKEEEDKLVAAEAELVELGALTSEVTSIDYFFEDRNGTYNAKMTEIADGVYYTANKYVPWARIKFTINNSVGLPVNPVYDANLCKGSIAASSTPKCLYPIETDPTTWITPTEGWYAIVYTESTKTFTATYFATEPVNTGIANMVVTHKSGENTTPITVVPENGVYTALVELAKDDVVSFKATATGGYPIDTTKTDKDFTADKAGWYAISFDAKTLTYTEPSYSETKPELTLTSITYNHTSGSGEMTKVEGKDVYYVVHQYNQWNRIQFTINYSLGAPTVPSYDAAICKGSFAATSSPKCLYPIEDDPTTWITPTAGWYAIVYDAEAKTFTATYFESEPTTEDFLK